MEQYFNKHYKMAKTKEIPADKVTPRHIVRNQFTALLEPKEEPMNLPSCTVPEQGLTIQEIIAKYVRTGQMPVAVHDDQGGNTAWEPDFDPLDQSPEAVARYLQQEKEMKEEKEPKGDEKDPPTDPPAGE